MAPARYDRVAMQSTCNKKELELQGAIQERDLSFHFLDLLRLSIALRLHFIQGFLEARNLSGQQARFNVAIIGFQWVASGPARMHPSWGTGTFILLGVRYLLNLVCTVVQLYIIAFGAYRVAERRS